MDGRDSGGSVSVVGFLPARRQSVPVSYAAPVARQPVFAHGSPTVRLSSRRA